MILVGNNLIAKGNLLSLSLLNVSEHSVVCIVDVDCDAPTTDPVMMAELPAQYSGLERRMARVCNFARPCVLEIEVECMHSGNK